MKCSVYRVVDYPREWMNAFAGEGGNSSSNDHGSHGCEWVLDHVRAVFRFMFTLDPRSFLPKLSPSITHLSQVAGRVWVDTLEHRKLVRDELEREGTDESREAVVARDHNWLIVEAFRQLFPITKFRHIDSGSKIRCTCY